MNERKQLEFISSVEIMNTPMKKQRFIVDGMIYPGLHILSGDPKLGKSWMMMDMCLSIAKGEKFLGRKTEQGQVIYMALEDTFISLQSRLYELTDEPSEDLTFTLLANSIGKGLEEDLQECKNRFSGLLYCADCGSKLYFVRGTTIEPEKFNFICSRYRKHMGEEKCTPHMIRETVLDEIVLEEINKTLYYARTKTQEFTAYISKKSSSQLRKEINAKSTELAQSQQRVNELKTLFKRLYEDNVLGRISDDQFRTLSADYMDEQKALETKIPELDAEVERLKENSTNVHKFFDAAKKYTDIRELTPDVLRTFISKIVIHERKKKHDKNALQQIDIYFRYIGSMAEPKADDETIESEAKTETKITAIA